MKTKFNKESRNLLIAMLLGDGTVSNNFVFKMSHGEDQKEYLEWKIKLLNEHGIRNNGLKSYEQKQGYNVGSVVYYSQLNIIPFVKLLRRILYKPKKTVANRQLLNRLDALGLAIWYMDDGHINVQYARDGRVKALCIKIATCQTREENQILIDYFNEIWGISFYQFAEGRSTYSIACSTKEVHKFVALIKPYVLEIPSM